VLRNALTLKSLGNFRAGESHWKLLILDLVFPSSFWVSNSDTAAEFRYLRFLDQSLDQQRSFRKCCRTPHSLLWLLFYSLCSTKDIPCRSPSRFAMRERDSFNFLSLTKSYHWSITLSSAKTFRKWHIPRLEFFKNSKQWRE
jgi:hypothetical protein